MSGPMGAVPSKISSGDKACGTPGGRRYFWFGDFINGLYTKAALGYWLVLPLVVAYFSIKYAIAIILVEVLSYYVGYMILEFDCWYNSKSGEITIPEIYLWQPKSTELSAILERLHYFELKYVVTVRTFYCWLDSETAPIKNNLDWIEIVSLLNQLSLWIGKHFDDDENKKGETT